jgi:hypothetical protein
VEIQCGIYKGSYNISNISYLIYSTALLYLPTSHCWNSFNRYNFSIYIYVYTAFAPYLPSYTLSPPAPLPIDTNPPPSGKTQSAFQFSNFEKEKKYDIFGCLR